MAYGRSASCLLAGAVILALVTGCAAPAPTAPSAASRAAPAAGAPADSAAPRAPAPPETMVYGQVGPAAHYLALYVGMDKGFFQREGLDVEIVVVGAPIANVIAALAGGSIDTTALPPENLIAAMEHGAPIAMLGGVFATPLYGLVAVPGTTDMTQLAGKSIGVNTLKGSETTMIQRLLRRGGLQAGDYDFVASGATGSRLTALQSGALAAAALGQPHDFMAVNDGYVLLGRTSEVVRDWQFIAHVMRRQWAAENDERVVRYLRAYIAAAEWIYDPANKNEALAVLVDRLKTSEAIARQSFELQIEQAQSLSRHGDVTLPGLRTVIEVMVEEGDLVAPAPSPEKYLDLTYLRRAQAAPR